MTYEEFKDAIASKIADYLGSEYSNAKICITPVIKANSLHLDGLNIRRKEDTICPTIYINQYYDEFQKGRELDDILSEIANIRKTHSKPSGLDVSEITDFEQIKHRIYAKLINRSQNEEYLRDKPNTDIADLSAIYYIDFGSDSDTRMSTVITDSLLSRYEISVSELHQIAIQNMADTAKFCSISETLSELVPHDCMPDSICMSDDSMYVLSSRTKYNGAALLLCPEVMDMVSKRIGKKYYLLPSSIHETILVPIRPSVDLASLSSIVHEVNVTQLSPCDYLSDSVYYYDYNTHSLKIAA